MNISASNSSEKWKSCEIYQRMCDVYREVCLSQKKMFINGLSMGLSLSAGLKKTDFRVKTNWLSSKEKVMATAVS